MYVYSCIFIILDDNASCPYPIDAPKGYVHKDRDCDYLGGALDGSFCTYSCDTGYVIADDNEFLVQCVDKRWRGWVGCRNFSAPQSLTVSTSFDGMATRVSVSHERAIRLLPDEVIELCSVWRGLPLRPTGDDAFSWFNDVYSWISLPGEYWLGMWCVL